MEYLALTPIDGCLKGYRQKNLSIASLFWLNSLVIDLGAQVIPIDGKTLKGSYDRNQEQSALHMVSAWASKHRLFLGQVKVDDKSNEITAIPALLELLDISGCIITIDAMGTQHEIARRIIRDSLRL